MRRYLLYPIVFVIFILSIILYFTSPEVIFKTSTIYSPVYVQLRQCLNSAYTLKTNDSEYIDAFRDCVKKYTQNFTFDTFYMGRHTERKVFLPLKAGFNQENCRWLTAGIGGTVTAEILFKEKYPGCKVVGVEPSSDQYLGFEKVGKVIPFGLGVTNGTFELTLKEGLIHGKYVYVKRKVPVMALSEILDKEVGTRTVQYMTIDIEGFEYNILEQLLSGNILAQQNITFCQIDAELHGFNRTQIPIIMHKFNSAESDYVPVFTEGFMIHEKVTWVNVKNPECREAFDITLLL